VGDVDAVDAARPGVVVRWDADEGVGEIDVPGLGRVWSHYSVIAEDPMTFRVLEAGDRVLVEVEPRDDDSTSEAPGYRWVATTITVL
jgi:hypothetical protein